MVGVNQNLGHNQSSVFNSWSENLPEQRQAPKNEFKGRNSRS